MTTGPELRVSTSLRPGRTARLTAETGLDGARGQILPACWPIKGELDLRLLIAEVHKAGDLIALPVVETRSAPLVFRDRAPETRMMRGDWNIPAPPDMARRLIPGIALWPQVGRASGGWRPGCGGGCFDRSLAGLSPRLHVSVGGRHDGRHQMRPCLWCRRVFRRAASRVPIRRFDAMRAGPASAARRPPSPASGRWVATPAKARETRTGNRSSRRPQAPAVAA